MQENQNNTESNDSETTVFIGGLAIGFLAGTCPPLAVLLVIVLVAMSKKKGA